MTLNMGSAEVFVTDECGNEISLGKTNKVEIGSNITFSVEPSDWCKTLNDMKDSLYWYKKVNNNKMPEWRG